MVKYFERRTICYNDLWTLCNKQEWYTNGTNSDYEDLLLNASAIGNITTEDIYVIATNIYKHSDFDYEYQFMGEEEIIENIMFLICKYACITVFIKSN